MNIKARTMKLVANVVVTAVGFWLLQMLLSVALFGSWFITLTVRLLTCFQLSFAESSFQAFVSGILNVLTWPIRMIWRGEAFRDSATGMILVFAGDSVIWGIAFGVLVYAVRKRLDKEKAA